MKKILAIIIILALLAAIWAIFFRKEAAPPAAPSLPDTALSSEQIEEQSPSAAVLLLLDAVRDYDVAEMKNHLTNPSRVSVTNSNTADIEFVRSLTGRLQYAVLGERVNGDTAEVDVSVIAADLGKAISDLVTAVTKYAASSMLKGETPDMVAFMEEQMQAIDTSALPTVTTQTTVTLKRQSDGEWLVENGEGVNTGLVDAITGGALEKIQSLADTAEKFGVTIVNMLL